MPNVVPNSGDEEGENVETCEVPVKEIRGREAKRV
jgi:hypothetical protein